MRLSRSLKTETVALGATVVAGFGAIAFLPSYLWPRCPVYALTGIYCPGCGGQRAVSALLHGDFLGAVDQNALIFVIPIFIVLGFWVQRLNKRWLTFLAVASVAVVALIFVILRNQPGSWLAPN
ncbi:MAG: DUF2752 domain-containing protein [Micrococcales bacterium]